MAEKLLHEELLALGNRLIHLRFSTDPERIGSIFPEISLADYMILIMLSRRLGIHEPEAKVYLSEISAELNTPITHVSQLVQRLQGKGYIYWQHDKGGNQGTYIYLSETGREVIKRQQEFLHKYIGRVIENMGYEKFVQILDLMAELEDVMVEEAGKMSEQ